jgi:hypothetical protein
VYDVELMSPANLERGMSILKNIELGLELLGTETPWQDTEWTENALMSKGFRKVRKSTIFAVGDGNGKARVVCVYTRGVQTTRLGDLGGHVFGSAGHESSIRGSAGQSVVKRGPRKRQEGHMVMYGTQVVYGRNAACLGLTTKWQPGAYFVTGRRDSQLNELVAALAEEMSVLEEALTPAAAQARAARLDALDPEKKHRISEQCKGLSMAVTSGYVASPHADSSVDNEHIIFRCMDGPLADGHNWSFAIPCYILGLPARKGGGAHVSVAPGMYHGTLPSSSTEAHHANGNLGCALVTKSEVVTALKKQRARKETTPTHLTASHVYSCEARTL